MQRRQRRRRLGISNSADPSVVVCTPLSRRQLQVVVVSYENERLVAIAIAAAAAVGVQAWAVRCRQVVSAVSACVDDGVQPVALQYVVDLLVYKF